jgi:PAS domain S-box-containing protein
LGLTDGLPFGWATFHRSPQAMAVLDTDGVFVAVNDAFTDAFGYKPDWVLGRPADRIVSDSPDERDAMRRTWHLLLRDGRIDYVRHVVHAGGHHLRIRGAAERGFVTGRSLVLTIALSIGPAKPRLTPREAELIGHVAAGKRAHQIAGELHLATSTVHTHLRNAMVKMGAHSQAQLVALALKRGELDPQLP